MEKMKEKIKEYTIEVKVDDRAVTIRDKVSTNYLDGEAYQMADLFYRAMLANGYSPAVTTEALAKTARERGHFVDDKQAGLNFGQATS